MVHVMTQYGRGSRWAPWLETVWLQRYLERRLDAEEAAWFEAYLLDNPALVERLEGDLDLRDALDLVRDSGPVALAQPTDSDGGDAGDIVRLARRGRAAPARYLRPLALAATLIAGVAVGWFGRVVAPIGGDGVIASPMRVVYDTERGTATAPLVEHGDSNAPLAFVEVAVPPGAQAVTLHMAGAPDQRLQPSGEGFVSFFVARRQLFGEDSAELTYEIDGALKRRTLAFAPLRKASSR